MKLTVIKRVAAMVSVVGLAMGLATDAGAASGCLLYTSDAADE